MHLCVFRVRKTLQPRNQDLYIYPCLSYLLFIVAQSLTPVQLFCDPMDWTPPGSSALGISQARILEWLAISQARDQTYIFCIAGGFFTTVPPGKSCYSKYKYVNYPLENDIFLIKYLFFLINIKMESHNTLKRNLKELRTYISFLF